MLFFGNHDDGHGTIVWEAKPREVLETLIKNSVFILGDQYVSMEIVEKEFEKNFTKVEFR